MKKLLIIGLFIITITSLTACKKEEEPTNQVDPNYAINEVRDPSEEEEESDKELSVTIPESSVEESTSTEEHEIIISNPKDQIYNIEYDEYAQEVRDMNTISIDGKLIGFPCTYQYATEIFGQLNTITYNSKFGDTFSPIDENLTATSFDVYAIPTTGEGTIRFTFKSSTGNPTTITEMSCADVMVQGGNTTGENVMTFALPQFITFGSTFEDLLNVFGSTNATHYESSNNASEYRIRFVFEDLNQCYDFTGYDNGLFIAKLNYNYNN